ncbi:MAG: diacylglycerol kinase family lipid kinase [Chitinophagales bacterium]|nr:diacylglycerol kinase family lipid kinase [Chitinophagales bacterium]
MSIIESWYIIINPRAGQGKGKKRWISLEKSLIEKGISYSSSYTEYKGQSSFIVRQAVEQGFRKFICIGGDGSFHHLVNGLSNSNIPATEVELLIVSAGTGNDFARNYNMPRGNEILDLIDNGDRHIQDLGTVTYQVDGENQKSFFHNFAGAGFDSYVIKNNSNLKWLGASSYMFSIFTSFLSYSNKHCLINAGGDIIEGKIYMMLASVGTYCGGGMRINKNAVTDDGLLDLLIARDINKLDVALNVSSLYNGSISSHPKVYTRQVEQLSIIPKDILSVEADGELLGIAPSEIKIVPKALKVLIPRDFRS